ncbi:hypothetical protein [Acinetobacter sp. NyZ410]|uniref:hypothetical protein n=1 Tax=Acinetobacter sp. NyZ410 TaxID=2929509 RepID=UPI001FBAC035|nr:hypothetical protein [Acinetobacter sp. NyZ410]UOH19858.1 hypothetical protein MTO68_06840 [Acinetobacter sp. NyZ410]
MDIEKEREEFEKEAFKQSGGWATFHKAYGDVYENNQLNFAWKVWLAAKQQATPEGFVFVDKKHTEDWYLDDHEGMWWDQDGIDNSLCDLDPGQVQAVEHKEYLITESNTLYAAKVWDESNDQVGYWEFFKTKDEAEKVAAYCKAKFKGDLVEAQEQSHDNSN